MFWDVFYKNYLIYLDDALWNPYSPYNTGMLMACRYVIDECQLRCMEIISGKKASGYCWTNYNYEPKN